MKKEYILTLNETADLLRVSRPTLLHLANSSQIPCRRVGRNWRFLREEVLSWLSGKDHGSRSKGRSYERKT